MRLVDLGAAVCKMQRNLSKNSVSFVQISDLSLIAHAGARCFITALRTHGLQLSPHPHAAHVTLMSVHDQEHSMSRRVVS